MGEDDGEREEGQGWEEAGLPRPCGARNDGEGTDPPSPAASADEQAGKIQSGRHRPVQIARTGKRKYFDEAAQAEFLEWFAATGNLAWSAEEAGFNYKTVLRHRMNDERFAEGWDRAVRQCYARLEAKRLETKRKAAPIGIEGDRDAPEMDDMAPERIDAILREYKRGIGGVKKPGRRPRVASNAEVRAALVKSLAAFAERIEARKEGEENPPAGEEGQ
jgi:hypothetical protein